MLAPGETADFEITLQPANRTGHYKKAIVFQTNDPDQPWFHLFPRANIESTLIVTKSSFQHRPKAVGDVLDETFFVTARDGEPFELTNVITRDEMIVEYEKLGDGSAYAVKVISMSLGQEDTHWASLRTDKPGAGHISLTVHHAAVR